MDDPRVDVVRRAFQAFAARDVEEMLPVLDPDVEFLPVTAVILGQGEAYHGHEGMRRYFADVAEVWDELVVTPREFRVVGDHVVATGRVYARGAGRVVDSPAGWVWIVRDGLIVWGRVFADAEGALAYARPAA